MWKTLISLKFSHLTVRDLMEKQVRTIRKAFISLHLLESEHRDIKFSS